MPKVSVPGDFVKDIDRETLRSILQLAYEHLRNTGQELTVDQLLVVLRGRSL